MDEKRTDLNAALRELAGEEAGDIGPHPGVRRLIAYREGRLPAVEREAVEEHLSLCRRCTGLLLELRDFEAAAARGDAGPERLRQEAWESLVRRLPARTAVVRPIAGAPSRAAQPWRRFPRLAAGVAAALLLAVAGSALWTVVALLEARQHVARLERQLEEREAAFAALESSRAEAIRRLAEEQGRTQDLEEERSEREDEHVARLAELSSELDELRRANRAPAVREETAVAARDIEVFVTPRLVMRGQGDSAGGFLRAGGLLNRVRPTPPDDRLELPVSLDDHPAFAEYRLELADREGRVLWEGRRPGESLLGDAGAEVRVLGLGPGRCWFRIEGLRGDRGELLDEYLLEVVP